MTVWRWCKRGRRRERHCSGPRCFKGYRVKWLSTHMGHNDAVARTPRHRVVHLTTRVYGNVPKPQLGPVQWILASQEKAWRQKPVLLWLRVGL